MKIEIKRIKKNKKMKRKMNHKYNLKIFKMYNQYF